MDLSTSIKEFKKIPPKYHKKLEKLGILTLKDFLFHFPYTYENFSKITSIDKVKLNQVVCIKGEIQSIKNIQTYKKRFVVTQAMVKDSTGSLAAVWFNQPFLINVLHKNDKVYLAGKMALSKEGSYLQNPSYERILPKKAYLHTKRLVPVYPKTEGITSRWLRFIIYPLLKNFASSVPEILPAFVREDLNLLPIQKALFEIHFPSSLILAKRARHRFAFQELFLLELLVLRKKYQRLKKQSTDNYYQIKHG